MVVNNDFAATLAQLQLALDMIFTNPQHAQKLVANALANLKTAPAVPKEVA